MNVRKQVNGVGGLIFECGGGGGGVMGVRMMSAAGLVCKHLSERRQLGDCSNGNQWFLYEHPRCFQ